MWLLFENKMIDIFLQWEDKACVTHGLKNKSCEQSKTLVSRNCIILRHREKNTNEKGVKNKTFSVKFCNLENISFQIHHIPYCEKFQLRKYNQPSWHIVSSLVKNENRHVFKYLWFMEIYMVLCILLLRNSEIWEAEDSRTYFCILSIMDHTSLLLSHFPSSLKW